MAGGQSELELQALHRVIGSGARALDLDVVVNRCLEQAILLAHTDAGALYLHDPERGQWLRARERNCEYAPAVLTPASRPSGASYYYDLRDYAARQPSAAAALERGYRQTLILVLTVDGRHTGFLALNLRADVPKLAESTLRTLEAIAGFEAVALESARVHRQVALRARLAQMLVDCSEQLLDPDADCAALILETARAMIDGDRALLARIEMRNGEGVVAFTRGLGPVARLVGQTVPTATPYLHESLTSTAPTVVEDSATLDADTVIGRMAREFQTGACVIVNMRQRDQPIGQLFVGASHPRPFAHEEVEALKLLSTLGAHALSRAERQSAERAQHARVADILEHIPIVVAVIDKAGSVVHVNAAGRAFADRIGERDRTDFRSALAALRVYDRDGNELPADEGGVMRAFRGESTSRELTLETTRGVKIHVLAVSAPLRAADGSIDAALTSFQDVTDLRELADMKDRFLSIASHELRSPITSLRATTSLLQLDPKALEDASRRAVLLSRIQRQIDRLSTLVERLLDTTRLGAGELPLDLTDCDLVRLCQEAVEHSRLTDGDHRYAVEAPATISGHWDPARIEQVLTNLLSNACRYSPPKSEILVRARVAGENALVDVVDQGPGIAYEQQEKLFTPFYRGAAAARHKGGLGLGLYITREIVRRHGGQLRISSEPGHGATFTVELPLHGK